MSAHIQAYPEDIWALKPWGERYALLGIWRELGIIAWIEVEREVIARIIWP